MQTNAVLFFRLQMIGVLLLLLIIIDLYSWRGVSALIRNMRPRTKKVIKYIFFGVSAVILLSNASFIFFTELEHYKALKGASTTFAIAVIASKISFMLFVLLGDVFHTLQWVIRKISGKKKRVQPVPVEPDVNPNAGAPATISRGQFIYQSGLIVAAAPLYFFTRGAIKDAHNYQVRRITMPSHNLPEAFNGLKIVQISDVHSGSFMDKDAVYKGVKLVLQEKPDVFFFTGDMVNTYAYEMNDYLDVFAPIKAPMGSYSILGNHDYGDYARNWNSEEEKAANLQALVKHHKDLNWQLMRNEHVVLDRQGQKLGIIGVENWGDKARFQKYGDLDKARKGMPDTPYKILLSHDPSHWDSVVRKQHPDIDLTLAGHTHGMQFGIENRFIKFSPVQWMYKQWAGLYSEGNQHIYVNRGYGYIGYPGRVGILPEITVIELVKA